MEPILRTEHLTFTYPGEERPTLGDLSLEIARGSFVAVLGHNGSGKSTLVHLLDRLYDVPEGSGRITIGGRVVYDSEAGINIPPNKRKVGFLFQNYALYPHMNVFDNITYGLKVRGIPADERKRRAEVRARLKKVESEIEELGAHIVELENEINDPEVLRDHLLLRDKCDELDDTRFHQQELYDEWEKLAEEQETFENEGE